MLRPSGSERSCEHRRRPSKPRMPEADDDQVEVAAAHAHQRFLERVDGGHFVARLQARP